MKNPFRNRTTAMNATLSWLCYITVVAKLQIAFTRGGRKGDVLSFSQAVVRLGRNSDNDVVFDAEKDRKASSHHAQIIRNGDRFIIHDLDSTNGTFVSGARIDEELALSNGESVMFGAAGPIVTIRIIGAAHNPHDPTANVDMVPEIEQQDQSFPSTEKGGGVDNYSAIHGENDRNKESSAATPELDPSSRAKKSTVPATSSELLTAEPKPSGRTAFYHAMMMDTVSRARRPLVIMIALLAVLLIITGLTSFLYIYKESDESESQFQEDEKRLLALEKKAKSLERRLKAARAANKDTQNELAIGTRQLIALKERLRTASGTTRRDLAAKAQALEQSHAKLVKRLEDNQKELARLTKTTLAAEQIAVRFDKALFMLIAQTPKGERGYCTAFAIHHTGLLATNAHCVSFAEKLKKSGLKTYARMNRSPEFTYEVVSWKVHPDYNQTVFSADVALIQLKLNNVELPVEVQLATDNEVIQLRPGRAIYTMGYPGKVMNPHSPDASLRASVISRLTTYDKVPSDPKFTRMLWHSALTSKGTSGSPIFDANGKVIAVNNGGLSARRILSESPVGDKNVEVAYDATGLNFGVRVDSLRELLPAHIQSR